MSDDPSPTPPAYARRWIKRMPGSFDTWRVPGLELAHREIGHIYGDAILSAHLPEDVDYMAVERLPTVVALRDEMLARAADLMGFDWVFRVTISYVSDTAKWREYEAMLERWIRNEQPTVDKQSEYREWDACEEGPSEVSHVIVVLEVYNLPEAMRPKPTAVKEEE